MPLLLLEYGRKVVNLLAERVLSGFAQAIRQNEVRLSVDPLLGLLLWKWIALVLLGLPGRLALLPTLARPIPSNPACRIVAIGLILGILLRGGQKVGDIARNVLDVGFVGKRDLKLVSTAKTDQCGPKGTKKRPTDSQPGKLGSSPCIGDTASIDDPRR